jgi:S-adenosylmethionine synthetase
MQRSNYLFTSESVSEGHPDKVCDRISDEVVDTFFRLGPKHGFAPKDLRVACETLATTNRVVIAGETRGPEQITKDMIIDAARFAVRDIGYEQDGFHWKRCNIEVLLKQSPTSPKASMQRATRTRGRATRASCSAMRAARHRNSCRRRSTTRTRS